MRKGGRYYVRDGEAVPEEQAFLTRPTESAPLPTPEPEPDSGSDITTEEDEQS